MTNKILVAALAAMLPAVAGDTKTWSLETYSDFEKGERQKLSLRSDGLLMLAPALVELHDPSLAALWAVAADSKGNIYAGGGNAGGSKAKLIRIDAAGTATTVAELDGLAIQAIAIDKRDRVYAATSPDGKVYRIENGRPSVFYDPKTKYIWALALSSAGDLFVGTGDDGEIHRVTQDGRGSVFFKTDEAHARSLAFDTAGNLIAGTDPNGLVLRITAAGQGFVLYQSSKREITSLAVGSDGSIFAAAVGTRSATPPPAATAPATPAPATGGGVTITMGSQRPAGTPPPSTAPAAPAVSGGSELYKIEADGYPRRLWSHSQDVIYSIVLDREGKPWIGTGNRGNVYRVDSEIVYTLLLSVAPTQVTGLAALPNGGVAAITSNIAKVYRLGPGFEKQGTYETEVFDAGGFSYWGRTSYTGQLNGGAIKMETRSGNLSRAQSNWSPWAEPESATRRAVSPAARFSQVRATLTAAADGKSPQLEFVELAYLGKNVAPLVEEIEMTPPNYRFPAPSTLLSSSNTLSLPAMSRRRTPTAAAPLAPSESTTTTPSMLQAKGSLGARWLARDDNGDTLEFKVEMRGSKETEWKLLRDKVRDRYLSFDSTMFPDGEYVLRVSATDAPSNPPAQALTSTLVGPAFNIDNTPPKITDLRATAQGNKMEIRWRAADALTVIGKAEYSINGGEWLVAEPASRLTDSADHEYRLLLDRPAGEVTIAVRVADGFENQAVEKTVLR